MAIIIGDIHGCRRQLEALLALVEPSADQTIVTLGDYIDRGPDTKGVIDCLIELKRTHNLIHLKGNHDVFMENARTSQAHYAFWVRDDIGGKETLDSYGGNLTDVPQSHWDFLENSPLYHELENYICAHGGIDANKPVDQQKADTFLNKRFHVAAPHCSGKTIICGHTRQVDGIPKSLGHTLCIDTNVFDGGYLTAFDTDSGILYQVNEQGDRRQITFG